MRVLQNVFQTLNLSVKSTLLNENVYKLKYIILSLSQQHKLTKVMVALLLTIWLRRIKNTYRFWVPI